MPNGFSPWSFPNASQGSQPLTLEEQLRLLALQQQRAPAEESLIGDPIAPAADAISPQLLMQGPSTKRTTMTETPQFMSPEQFQSTYEATATMPQFQAQQQYLNELSGIMKARAQNRVEPQLDISPLFSLIEDPGVRQSLLQTYQRPDYDKPYQESAQAAKMMLDEQRQMQKSILDTLDKRKLGTTKTQLTEESGVGRAQQKDTRIITKDVQTDTNKIADKFSEGMRELERAKGELESGNLIRMTATLSSIAKGVGKESGALSDSDVGRYFPRTIATDFAGLEKYLTDNPAAKVDPAITKPLRDMVAEGIQKLIRYNKDIATRRLEQYQASPQYAPVGATTLAPHIKRIKEFEKKYSAPVVQPPQITKAEAAAELARRRAGK